MKALVTGGTGFIGSFLCEKLIEKGYDVICYDDLSRGSIENIKQLLKRERFELIKDDILNYKKLNHTVKKCDIIYHLAAINGTKYFYEKPSRIIDVNIIGTKNVLESARKNDISRIVFTSSSEVYGKPKKIPTSEGEECVFYNPVKTFRHSYSSSKIIGEYLCLSSYKNYNLPVTILRYFNIYGPRLIGTSYGQVVSIFFNQVLNGGPVTIHRDGNQTRSFTYVDEAVDGTVLAGESKKAIGEVFNLGQDKEVTINNLAKNIMEVCGKQVDIKYIDSPPGDCKRRNPDISKIKNILKWNYNINLIDGLKITYKWFIKKKASFVI